MEQRSHARLYPMSVLTCRNEWNLSNSDWLKFALTTAQNPATKYVIILCNLKSLLHLQILILLTHLIQHL